MFRAIWGLIPAIIFSIILFIINPIIGLVWILWLVGVTIYTLKRNKK